MTYSIRRQLLVMLSSTTLAVWTATALVSYVDARREVDSLFDAQLAQAARVLMSLVRHEVEEELTASSGREGEKQFIDELEEHLSAGRYEHKVAFQIWVGRDGSVLRSASAPEVPLSEVNDGFSEQKVAGKRWRVMTLSEDNESIRIHVGEQLEVRKQLIHRIALRLLIPLLLGLPLLAVLIWFSVRRSLAPLNQLARDIAKRAPSHLEPIRHNPVPVEARPIVDALNGLFSRLRQAFEREKRLTADAAHELRTPLAGLKTQAEVAQRATDDTKRRKALSQMINGVDRSTHLVEQLLTMARLDPEVGLQDFVELNLGEIASEVVAELSGNATVKQIDLGLEERCEGRIRGNTEALRVLVRNLVDNAIRYSPNAGLVTVSITSVEGQVILRVIDNGPGIPLDMRENVFERFYRGHQSLASGSGLGLSIVRRIADLHNATINLKTSLHGGLEVEVIFPRPDIHPLTH